MAQLANCWGHPGYAPNGKQTTSTQQTMWSEVSLVISLVISLVRSLWRSLFGLDSLWSEISLADSLWWHLYSRRSLWWSLWWVSLVESLWWNSLWWRFVEVSLDNLKALKAEPCNKDLVVKPDALILVRSISRIRNKATKCLPHVQWERSTPFEKRKE